MDEVALVALAVLEVVRHLISGVADGHLDIRVAEQHHAPGDEVALGLHRGGLDVPHPHDLGLSTYSVLVEYIGFHP